MSIVLFLVAWFVLASVFALVWGSLCRIGEDEASLARAEAEAPRRTMSA